MKHLPLTRDDLVSIQDRTLGKAADIKALLWEVKRLRSVILRTADAVRNAKHSVGPNMLDTALVTLEQEPCVIEDRIARES